MVSSHLPTSFWLLKTEPGVFSFQDLLQKKTTLWDGVRNYQARNFMRDHMAVGHWVWIYHSGANPPHLAGLAQVVGPAVADATAQDPQSAHYEPRTENHPNPWVAVKIGKPQPIKRQPSLGQLREYPQLAQMLLLQKGQRLSILPLTQSEHHFLMKITGGN